MWLLLASVLVLAFLWRARREGHDWFDQFQLDAMYAFARVWHRCTSNRPAPVPEHGPAIVIANHCCHADPCFLMATCPRPLSFLQAKECFEVFLLRHLFRRAGCIPVARDGHDVAAVRQSLRRLKAGRVLAIFPEGYLERDNLDDLGPPKPGVAYLALQSRAPVIPAYIAGRPRTCDMLRSWLCPSRGVRVLYGPPVDLSRYYGRKIDDRLVAEVSELLMQKIADLRLVPRIHRVPAPPKNPLRRTA